MESLLGLLSIHVQNGVNLASRDIGSSDPYIIFRLADQQVKTKVVKNNNNPVWDEVLTLAIFKTLPIRMEVFDKDTFSKDDELGDAEFDINPFLEAVKIRFDDLPNETIITTVKPARNNCIAEESHIKWTNGKVIQKMILRLRNTTSGEIEIQLGWTDVPGSKGLQ